MAKPNNTLRDIAMTRVVLEGTTYEATAAAFDVSRERVRQVVSKKLRQMTHPYYGEVPARVKEAEGLEGKRQEKEFWLARLTVMEERYMTPPKPVATAVDLLTTIESFNLTIRTENCLKAEGITTVGDLVKYTELQLRKIPNMGQKSIDELKAIMHENGYELAMRSVCSLSDSIRVLSKRFYSDTVNDIPYLEQHGIRTIEELINHSKSHLEQLISRRLAEPYKNFAYDHVKDIMGVLEEEGYYLRGEFIKGWRGKETDMQWHENILKLDISTAHVTYLRRHGITRVGELVAMTTKEFKSLHGLTLKTHDDVVEAMQSRRLTFRKG